MLKIGDKVRWLNSPEHVWVGEIIDGPWGGLTGHKWDENTGTYAVRGRIDGLAWLVQFATECRLLGEGVLEPVGRWEPCSGEPRLMGSLREAGGVATHWERRV